jgi:hypothetical protein
MFIKCYYCELAFRKELYLQQHLINNYTCNYKRKKMLVNISNKNNINNKTNNIKNDIIVEKLHQSKLNRLKNRSELKKIQSTITFSEDVNNNINTICNQSARRLSDILKFNLTTF